MARFLSSEWCAEVVATVAKDASIAGQTVTIEQLVTAGPDGDVTYWMSFADGNVSGGIGKADRPDVVITQDYATATELARGELVAQAAFMQGRLKVTGSMGALLQNQTALAALGPAMSSLETTY
jgi:hypothetical protein